MDAARDTMNDDVTPHGRAVLSTLGPSMTTLRPSTLSRAALALSIAIASTGALADDAADCKAVDGTFLTGVVQSTPTFARGSKRHGVELSHTHIALKGDADSKRYVIAVDNVFASGYLRSERVVPPPLDGIHKGDHLELCGIAYSGGMHWVHTNCGDKPTAEDPDGWLKVLAADGSAGPNLEGSRTYCRLWPKK
jgi:hypothetical protein